MKNRKHFIVAATFLMTIARVMAQREEPVLLSVNYQYTHVYNINDREHPYTKTMVLHLGETNSKYNDAEAEAARKAQQKAMAESPTRPMKVVSGQLASVFKSINSDEVFYQLPFENKIVQVASLGSTSYKVDLPAPVIKWKIEKETRQIDKYICQKAVGAFGGRTYTVWFTSELPFKNGPWKLCGLPGLILEAKDDKNEVAFIFKEITKGEPDEIITANLNRTVKVDESAYLRAKKLFADDSMGVTQSQFPNYKDPISFIYIDPSGKSYSGDAAKEAVKNDKKINNNPVELVKK